MELFIIGFIVAANVIFIMFKLKKSRTADAILDVMLLILITTVFSGSYASLVVGTVASLIISIYLYANPPKLPEIDSNKLDIDKDEFYKELKTRLQRRY